jgi:L-aspartate oxidase
LQSVRAIVSRTAGVLRDGADLRRAASELYPLAPTNDAALVALMIVTAALRREESRGAHYRLDFTQKDATPAWPRDIDSIHAFAAARELSLADVA